MVKVVHSSLLYN